MHVIGFHDFINVSYLRQTAIDALLVLRKNKVLNFFCSKVMTIHILSMSSFKVIGFLTALE